jgi:hypothetical protein
MNSRPRTQLVLAVLIIFGVGVWVWKARTPTLISGGTPEAQLEAPAESDGNSTAALPSGASPASASPAAAPAEASAFQKIVNTLKGADQRKLLMLEEILQSKNDNDPRLDTELRELSPELKRAMRDYYRMKAPELRNERGTVAFLTARAADSKADVDFLKSMLMESPCLSLANCSQDAPPPTAEELHVAGITETTLNYPQLTALRQSLDRYRRALGEEPPNTVLANQIIEMFREARNSPNRKVAGEAQMILKHLRL